MKDRSFPIQLCNSYYIPQNQFKETTGYKQDINSHPVFELFGGVLPEPDGAFSVTQGQLTQSTMFCGDTKFNHNGVEVAPYCALERSFKINEKVTWTYSSLTSLDLA